MKCTGSRRPSSENHKLKIKNSAVRSNEGIALILTLFILALLTAMALSFSVFTHQESLETRNFKEYTDSYFAALSAYNDVLAKLLNDKNPSCDYIDSDGNFVLGGDQNQPPAGGKWDKNGIEIKVKVSDEESRLNINTMGPDLFRKALEYFNVPDDQLDTIVDSVMDWREPGDLQRLNGAKSDYYESLDTPYDVKGTAFDTVDELLLVKGMKKQYMYNKSRYSQSGFNQSAASLESVLTTMGSGINVNTASKDVLAILGVDPLEISKIMAARKDFNGIRSIPPELAGFGINLISSTHFRIEVWAGQKGSGKGTGVKLTSIVIRSFDPQKGPELKTIYWKESA